MPLFYMVLLNKFSGIATFFFLAVLLDFPILFAPQINAFPLFAAETPFDPNAQVFFGPGSLGAAVHPQSTPSKPRSLNALAAGFAPGSMPNLPVRQANYDQSNYDTNTQRSVAAPIRQVQYEEGPEIGSAVQNPDPRQLPPRSNEAIMLASGNTTTNPTNSISAETFPAENDANQANKQSPHLLSPSVAPTSETSSPDILDQQIGGNWGTAGMEKVLDKMPRPSMPTGFSSLASVIGSLLIVMSIFFLLILFMKKVSPKGSRPLPKEVFEDLGRIQLTQKLPLHLLRLGNRLILVSITPDGVSPITEITHPDEVVQVLGMCRRLDPNSSSELFRKTLTQYVDGDSKTMKHAPMPASRSVRGTSMVDLYSDSDASLAELIAAGKHGR
ncbi:MAG: FliO/MopB family protein [Thermoguttaceae bacterium]